MRVVEPRDAGNFAICLIECETIEAVTRLTLRVEQDRRMNLIWVLPAFHESDAILAINRRYTYHALVRGPEGIDPLTGVETNSPPLPSPA